MKKRLSVASLGLRLCRNPVLLVFLITGASQLWVFWGRVGAGVSFVSILDDTFSVVGKMGFLVLLIVMLLVGCEFKGARFGYSLRRLRVKERSLTLIWAAMFSGIVLLYWLYQVGLIFGCWFYWSSQRELEPTALFMAAYTSRYFHLLLPLAEGWGYVRNAAMCIGFGAGAALAAHQLRHKRSAGIWFFIIVLLYGLNTSGSLATEIIDIMIVAATQLMGILLWVMLWKGDRDEKN